MIPQTVAVLIYMMVAFELGRRYGKKKAIKRLLEIIEEVRNKKEKEKL